MEDPSGSIHKFNDGIVFVRGPKLAADIIRADLQAAGWVLNVEKTM